MLCSFLFTSALGDFAIESWPHQSSRLLLSLASELCLDRNTTLFDELYLFFCRQAFLSLKLKFYHLLFIIRTISSHQDPPPCVLLWRRHRHHRIDGRGGLRGNDRSRGHTKVSFPDWNYLRKLSVPMPNLENVAILFFLTFLSFFCRYNNFPYKKVFMKIGCASNATKGT